MVLVSVKDLTVRKLHCFFFQGKIRKEAKFTNDFAIVKIFAKKQLVTFNTPLPAKQQTSSITMLSGDVELNSFATV